MATINLSEAEYEALKRKVIEADTRAAAAEKTADELKAGELQSIDVHLYAAYHAAKQVVDFAVGNLHPEFIKDMPWEALEILAYRVAKVGGDGERDRERELIWTEHVRIIKKFELERQLRGKDPEPGTFRRDKPV